MLLPIGNLENVFRCTALWGVCLIKSMSSFEVAGGKDQHGTSTNSMTDGWCKKKKETMYRLCKDQMQVLSSSKSANPAAAWQQI